MSDISSRWEQQAELGLDPNAFSFYTSTIRYELVELAAANPGTGFRTEVTPPADPELAARFEFMANLDDDRNNRHRSQAQRAEANARLIAATEGLDRQAWRQLTYLAAGIDPQRWIPERGLAFNDEAILRSYAYYGQIYLAQPSFQWAAMANLLGALFYAGWQDIYAIRHLTHDGERARLLTELMGIVTLPDPVYFGIDIVDAVLPPGPIEILTSDDLAWLETKMLSMQKQIFDDLAWMHTAFHFAGHAHLDSILANEGETQEVREAWFDMANGGEHRVRAGNAALLFREQWRIVQNDYDDIRNYRGPVGKIMSYVLTRTAGNPIPDGRPYREVVSRLIGFPIVELVRPSIWSPSPIRPRVAKVARIPMGDVTEFRDRWKWVVSDMLPAFDALASRPNDLARIVRTPIASRASKLRLIDLPYRRSLGGVGTA